MTDERRARTMIALGAAIALFGITLSVGDDELGKFLIVGGVVLLFVALHRFGRLGPDGGTHA